VCTSEEFHRKRKNLGQEGMDALVVTLPLISVLSLADSVMQHKCFYLKNDRTYYFLFLDE
jgi:hypothetical protein